MLPCFDHGLGKATLFARCDRRLIFLISSLEVLSLMLYFARIVSRRIAYGTRCSQPATAETRRWKAYTLKPLNRE